MLDVHCTMFKKHLPLRRIMYELVKTQFFSVRATLWIVLLFSPAIYAQGCTKGFFGPQCQYVDLIYTENDGTTRPELIDADDSTCNRDALHIISVVTFTQAVPFKWLRLLFKRRRGLQFSDIYVKFTDSDGNTNIQCNNAGSSVSADGQTVDIYCDINVDVKKFLVSGSAVGYLCSFYASGDCPHTQYGSRCENTCSTNCVNQYCTGYNGRCDDCPAGKEGLHCDTDCPRTQYGSRCVGTCSRNCVNQYCSGDNGRCDNCPAGKTGDQCDTNCSPGLYGPRCTTRCSSNCVGRLCDRETGKCDQCPSGETGDMCTNNCPRTQYGSRCVNTCSTNCVNRYCSGDNGRCDDCPDGKTGVYCDTDCLPTQYGSRCVGTCSTNCVNQICTGDNGRCDDCPAGKMGVHCDTTPDCPLGMYGTTCDKTCNQNCRDRDCDSLTGQCSVGCVPSYSGTMCQQECEPGKYGTDCSSDCSEFCNTNRSRENESPCHPVSGTCSSGCVQGYQGPACDTKPQSLLSSDSESGVGVGVGIGVGVCVLVAVAVVGVYFYRRRQLAQKARRERPPGYDPAEPTTEEHNYRELFKSDDGYNLPTDEASSPATLNVTSKTSTHDVVQYVNAEGKAEVNMTPYEDIDQVTSEMDQGKSSKAGENNSGYANF